MKSCQAYIRCIVYACAWLFLYVPKHKFEVTDGGCRCRRKIAVQYWGACLRLVVACYSEGIVATRRQCNYKRSRTVPGYGSVEVFTCFLHSLTTSLPLRCTWDIRGKCVSLLEGRIRFRCKTSTRCSPNFWKVHATHRPSFLSRKLLLAIDAFTSLDDALKAKCPTCRGARPSWIRRRRASPPPSCN